MISKTKQTTNIKPNNLSFDFLIIGGGPSGMSAAISLKKRYYHHRIAIIEKDVFGRKVKVSGNGKCNIGNDNFGETLVLNDAKYQDKLFSKSNIEVFKDLFLNDLNIITISEGGLLYPLSRQSQTVLDAFNNTLDRHHIIKINEEVVSLKEGELIEVKTHTNTYYSKRVILALGSKAYYKENNNNFFFDFLKNNRVLYREFSPGLTGYQVSDDISPLFGLRVNACVSLIKNKTVIFKERGEVQFKKDGISGIVIMNSSNTYERLIDKSNCFVSLNIIHEVRQNVNLDIILNSLDSKLVKYLALNNKEITLDLLQNIRFKIRDVYGFDYGQIAIGGVDLSEVKDNYELKKIPNVYVIGEMLDVDGICGGYNMMHAILSALILSLSI
jgi:predicted Rossmann fold flavoprotein